MFGKKKKPDENQVEVILYNNITIHMKNIDSTVCEHIVETLKSAPNSDTITLYNHGISIEFPLSQVRKATIDTWELKKNYIERQT